MAERGFACDMRGAPQFFTFRRITPDAVHVFDIQWEKRGRPRFLVNFGQCGAAGAMVGDLRIAPQDVSPSSTRLWGRLSPGSGGTTRGGIVGADQTRSGSNKKLNGGNTCVTSDRSAWD
jgi:hypothetical protein